MNHTYCP